MKALAKWFAKAGKSLDSAKTEGLATLIAGGKAAKAVGKAGAEVAGEALKRNPYKTAGAAGAAGFGSGYLAGDDDDDDQPRKKKKRAEWDD